MTSVSPINNQWDSISFKFSPTYFQNILIDKVDISPYLFSPNRDKSPISFFTNLPCLKNGTSSENLIKPKKIKYWNNKKTYNLRYPKNSPIKIKKKKNNRNLALN